MSTRKAYTPEQMAKAIKAVELGSPVASAAKKFKVPRVTLLYKVKGKSPKICKMGPSPVLSDFEKLLVKWITDLAERQYPVSKDQLLDSVKKFLDDSKTTIPHPFVNNRPGRKWFDAFLKRNPELSERVSQNLTSGRGSVTEAQIRGWFKEINKYLTEKNLLDVITDGNRVFNADESAFFLTPKGNKVITRKGDCNVYTIAHSDEKENLTVLVTTSASGKLLPPMIVYAYERIPSYIIEKVPKGIGIGKSESGWMCAATFFEYVTNIFEPWLTEENIQRPVLFFLDGHSSHLTLQLSQFCSDKQIEIIALYPNSTHVTQPLDVAVFRPLKVFWKNEVLRWRLKNGGTKFSKQDFAPVLVKALSNVTEQTIQNGFKTCGLVPFNVENVNFQKLCSSNRLRKLKVARKTRFDLQNILSYVESKIDNNKLENFETCFQDNELAFTIPEVDKTFFSFWRNLRLEIEKEKGNISESDSTENQIEEIDIIDEQILSVENADISGTRTKHPYVDAQPSSLENKTMQLSQTTNSTDIFQTSSTSITSNSLDAKHSLKPSSDNFVPSPFKRALFYPEDIRKIKNKRKKEKIPSVITSDAWKEYYEKKQAEKQRELELKEERKRMRQEKKDQKEREKELKKAAKRKIDFDESETENEESKEYYDMSDSDSNFEEEMAPEFCDMENPDVLNRGDYVLVKFKGGKRGSVFYRYVCLIQQVEDEIEVMSLKSADSSKTLFNVTESDLSFIQREDILGKLPVPKICMYGDRIKYKFTDPIDIFEAK